MVLHGAARTWREQSSQPGRYSKAGVVTIDLVSLTASQRDLTGWLWTGLIERISQDRRSRTCGEDRRRARSRSF
ncbi:hypothetical protein E4V01_01475 [Methylorubrum sp. Q1]|nr:hypothetical protein E4V01_01475 [Methylorubrum sp. Q1]